MTVRTVLASIWKFVTDNLVPIALGLLTFLGVTYTNKISALSLLSQREEAETNLRAQMFTSLLSPIVSTKIGEPMKVEREELMVSLLALNFDEDFEFGPLLRNVDDRLANPANEGLTEGAADSIREDMRAIARRVADTEETRILGTAPPDRKGTPQVSLIDMHQGARYCMTVDGSDDSAQARLRSPDGTHWVELTACEPNWAEQTVRINYVVERSDNEDAASMLVDPNDVAGSFVLSWYDFPLTDNLLLPDGNRFALRMRRFSPEDSTLSLMVIWFPKSFFTPRERPAIDRALASQRELQTDSKR